MNRLRSTRGTVFVVTVFFHTNDGLQTLHFEPEALGIAGVRATDFLAQDGSSLSFAPLVPELAGKEIESVVLSIAYPNGAFEITGRINLSGDCGFVAWEGPVMTLADPSPVGDPMVDPVFVVGRRHVPTPMASPLQSGGATLMP